MENVKTNGDVIFYENNHIYVNAKNPDIQYTSVTTLIKDYHESFDKEFWGGYKALENLMGKDFSLVKSYLLDKKKIDFEVSDLVDEEEYKKLKSTIIAEYDRKGLESSAYGTKIHKEKEEMFFRSEKINLQDCGFLLHEGVYDCERNNYDLNRERAVLPEYLIYYSDNNILHVAGQIDLLIKDGNDLYIYDYKGLALDTPIATKQGWKSMENIMVGDQIFDGDGKLTNVKHISEIHHNPCFKITFDTNDSLICDHEHRWVISERLKKGIDVEKEYITDQLYNLFLNKIPIKIKCNKSLELPEIELPIDPYILGAWLGDGSKTCGMITNINKAFWDEIVRRNYKIGNDISAENRAESRTILGLVTELKKLNLLNNKHIPDIYLRASHKQRLDLLRGLMDTDGYFHKSRKRCVMSTTQLWQADDLIKLITSLGWKATKIKCTKICGNKKFKGYDVCFNATENPFLVRNPNYLKEMKSVNFYNCSYKYITNIEKINTIPTKCLMVDSSTHTYLAGYNLTKTHNTNENGIESKAYFDKKKKQTKKMFFPLNNLDDTKLNHYTMQLSIYAWMLKQINPKFNIKRLCLIHIDHSGTETEIDVPFKEEEVKRLLKSFTKKLKIKALKDL